MTTSRAACAVCMRYLCVRVCLAPWRGVMRGRGAAGSSSPHSGLPEVVLLGDTVRMGTYFKLPLEKMRVRARARAREAFRRLREAIVAAARPTRFWLSKMMESDAACKKTPQSSESQKNKNIHIMAPSQSRLRGESKIWVASWQRKLVQSHPNGGDVFIYNEEKKWTYVCVVYHEPGPSSGTEGC
ncbi:hypothetical protein LX32DRAFT_404950 [Colletotrichum zoysiae]|uniref:Uncharacterized protein n=1 Tax=Colletotrichum zoysiae TaxID=1216348 RepID=A0AAD9HHM9_9PEZI|nr:hypothetical protein LX32DRAFT_404950 [Colletotrichum zoysiae]